MLAITIFWAVFLEAICMTPRAEETPWGEQEEDPLVESHVVIGSDTIPIGDLRLHLQRSLVSDPRRLWPGKEVPFVFTPGQFPAPLRAAVEEALQELMDRSCVKFTQRRNQTTFLKLKATGKGCVSKVGHHEDTPSTVQLGGPKCQTKGTIQHEFLHALGFWHEHTRPDRDDYVTVLWENIRPDRKKDFVKRDGNEVTIQGLPYDYGSVMHYKHTAFSKHRGTATLVPKNKEAVAVMGQRRGVSRVDIAKLNRLYNCTRHYRGDDLEGLKKVLGEDVANTSSKDITSKSDEVFLNTSKGIERKGYERDADNEKVNKSIKTYMKLPISYVLRAQEFNEEHILRHVEQPIQMRVKKVLIEKSIDVQTINSSEMSIVINKTSENTTILNTQLKNASRIKRDTVDMKQKSDKGTEMGQAPTDGQHEAFAPQKILPELLKGVLGNDKDRPIVIQFAIYQPIVYKTPNETESSGDKNVKQNAEKTTTEDNSETKNTKETSIKEDTQLETGQIRSLRDRENYFKENYNVEHDDDVIVYRNANSDDVQKRRDGTIKQIQKDSNSSPKNTKLEDKYRERPKEITNPRDDRYPALANDYIQPLKVSQLSEGYSQETPKYDERQSSNADTRRRYSQREDYQSYPRQYDTNDQRSQSYERPIPLERGSTVDRPYFSSREDHAGSSSLDDDHSLYNYNKNHDLLIDTTESFDRRNANKDALTISPKQEDHQSRDDFSGYDKNSNKESIQTSTTDYYTHSEPYVLEGKVNNNRPPQQAPPRTSFDFEKEYIESGSQKPMDLPDPFVKHITKDDQPTSNNKNILINENNDSPSWNQGEQDVNREINLSDSGKRLNIEPKITSQYSNIPNIGPEIIEESIKEPKRTRPDLFIEEPVNDDIDKQLKKQKVETQFIKDQPGALNLPHDLDDKVVLSRVKYEHLDPPINQIKEAPEKVIETKTYSKEEQNNKREILLDNEGLPTKPNSMLNLNPRQALPLNASPKSSTKRLVRVEKVQGRGQTKVT